VEVVLVVTARFAITIPTDGPFGFRGFGFFWVFPKRD